MEVGYDLCVQVIVPISRIGPKKGDQPERSVEGTHEILRYWETWREHVRDCGIEKHGETTWEAVVLRNMERTRERLRYWETWREHVRDCGIEKHGGNTWEIAVLMVFNSSHSWASSWLKSNDISESAFVLFLYWKSFFRHCLCLVSVMSSLEISEIIRWRNIYTMY